MLQRVLQYSYCPVLETNILEKLQRSFPFEKAGEAFRLNKMISLVSFLEHNLNPHTTRLMFVL